MIRYTRLKIRIITSCASIYYLCHYEEPQGDEVIFLLRLLRFARNDTKLTRRIIYFCVPFKVPENSKQVFEENFNLIKKSEGGG